ncbi:hypothetical protein EZH22_24700 [Xanthobacter dioxanivorans]|uniref:Uncharacterized protein n=1 Tax=Xanthobacter dioxanivorans TaxID=2528964 RepID=A0A974PM88_9HYPH|nr:hypothetical protein [Xanthobacter dioxanivorans]QRG06149.1 hypothetical protein EZH22_24700 [Xanthobacter dioxanivorans]
MKVTFLDIEMDDMQKALHLVRSYVTNGYADEGRNARRNAVIYAPKANAARCQGDDWQASVWGNRNHVRVAFANEEADHGRE